MSRLVATAAVVVVAIAWCLWDVFDPSALRDKVVLVSGASRGIGEQLAYQYATSGSVLFLAARDHGRLLQVAARCRQLGSPRVVVIAGDMGDANHRQEVVRRTLDLFGRLDILVLNHAHINRQRFWNGSDADLAALELSWRVNTVAYVDLATRTRELLSRSGGSVVVVSSIAGRIGWPTIAAYTASKFALEGFFGALRQELIFSGDNVSVTMCVIGLVATDTIMGMLEEQSTRMVAINAFIGQPDSTAAAIVKGAALKKSVLYYPWNVYWLELGHFVFPDLMNLIIRWGACPLVRPATGWGTGPSRHTPQNMAQPHN